MTEYNISLAKCIEQAVNTAGTLTYNFNRVNRMDGYTDEFKHQKRLEMEQSMAAKVEELTEQGLGIIDRIIEDTNAAERKEAERRAKDTEYTRRLNDKIEIVKLLAAKPEVSRKQIDALQISLAEFENDTLSIALIDAAVAGIPGAARFRTAIPANHNGEHQASMEKFKMLFSRAMSDAEATVKSRSGMDTSANKDYAHDLVTAFGAYCLYQSPNMSSDPAAVWLTVMQKFPDMTAASKDWMMRFGIADKIPQPKKK